MLNCSHLTVHAGKSDLKILDDIEAEFPSGKLNALVGPSGCGKTTLIKAFLGLVDSKGEIKVALQQNLWVNVGSGKSPS